MVTQSKSNTRRLGDIAPGTRVRLFAKYRDGSPRPRYRFGRTYLQQGDLEVIEHTATCTLVRAGKNTVPVCSDWRVNS